MRIRSLLYYISAGFVLGTLALVLVYYGNRRNVLQLIHGNESVLREYRLSNQLMKLEKEMILLDNTLKNEPISSESNLRPEVLNSLEKIKSTTQRIVMADSISLPAKYKSELVGLIEQKVQYTKALLGALTLPKEAPSSWATDRGPALSEKIRSLVYRIDRSDRIALAHTIKQSDRQGQLVLQWNLYIIAIALILFTLVFLIIVSRMKRQSELILQLNRSEKKLKEAAWVKENFLANMSHEIRTPLNAILGYTNLLSKKAQLDETSRLHLATVEQSGETLLAIVEDILDLSKIESGMMRIEAIPFDLRACIQSVMSMFLQKAEAKGLKLTSQVDEAIPSFLIGDPTRLTQILVNLIGNSIKFTFQGTVTLQLTSRYIGQDRLHLQVGILDTGIGIAPEKLDTIFERFRQAEDATTRQFGGTGLGLSIVRDLVHLQKGTIAINSTPNIGTTITFTIPYQVQGSDPQSLQTEPIKLNIENKKVLIVDDNPINRNLVGHMLANWDIAWAEAENGHQALDILLKEHFDLVFMDIQMPEMDGYTATRQIRQDLKLTTPVVAMTARAMKGEREKSLAAGMNEHITKPIREMDLKVICSSYLQLKAESTILKNQGLNFNRIDLGYMQEISNGDLEYEKLVTEQFLSLLPESLAALTKAMKDSDRLKIQRVAHQMKTSISIMGLDSWLMPKLDVLEDHGRGSQEIQETVLEVRTICQEALQEAQSYYNHLKRTASPT